MAGYTLLQLVDQVCGEMGLSQPPAVIGSTTQQTVQLLALTQRLGRDLIVEYEWNQLLRVKYQATASAVLGLTNGPNAIITTAATAAGNTTLSIISTIGTPAVGMVVTGTGVAPYSEISAYSAGSSVTLTLPLTATSDGTLNCYVQDYDLPSDFDRMVSDTNWDRTNHWRNLGPKSSQEWQWLQGGVISVGPRERYRIFGNKLRIFPALGSGYNFAYEYISKNWVLASGDTAGTKSLFSADNDTCIFPDNLMMAGLKYYFLKAKKLDYGLEMAEFDDILSKRKAQDEPVSAASLAPTQLPELVGPWSIQDGNWPTTSS